MTNYLELTVDKFTFKVATDRFYNREGVWAKPEGTQVRVGISDFVQQRSGDLAFAEVKPPGTHVALGDEIAVIETIKVDVSISSPISGVISSVNPTMESSPEIINTDPYGSGWLAVVDATDWEVDRLSLLDTQAYFLKMKSDAEHEVNE
jgi:glycine cleavage system H protein